MSNIIVRIIDLPCTVRGYTALDDEGDYNIYLNARLNPQQQEKAYNHEMRHITRDDWNDAKTVQMAEYM
ncbi:MAG: hypothetical protein J6A69_10755 [Clostridia bacterium]|nr:hypothetical protein [Clostridia bacterium]